MDTYESKGLYLADANKIILGIKLPKLEVGNKYNIHCVYNISENNAGTIVNKIVVHFTDLFGRALEELNSNIEPFAIPTGHIINTTGAAAIDFTKEISVALFHENDTPDRIIEQKSLDIYDNARNGTCNSLDFCSLSVKTPKSCGMGTIRP